MAKGNRFKIRIKVAFLEPILYRHFVIFEKDIHLVFFEQNQSVRKMKKKNIGIPIKLKIKSL